MYKIERLTVKERIEIPVGAVCEIPVNEVIDVEHGTDDYSTNYATVHLRKSLAVKGLLQAIHTPFPEGKHENPKVVVYNKHVAPISLNSGDEIASIWIFTQ